MRLGELFEDQPIIVEAPGDDGADKPVRTVTISLADIYKMTNRTPPAKMGPNGQLIMPEGFYDQKTYTVGGEDGVDVEIANAIDQYNAGGKVKGMIMKDNELRPYNDNHILVDLGWQFAAGTAELAASWMKGGSYVIDDVINNLTISGRLYKNKTGKNLSNLSKGTLSGYDNPEMDGDGKYKDDTWFMDRAREWLENKTDQQFRDNVDFTAGAVNSFDDLSSLIWGTSGFNLEGAAGIIISELPSEIVDVSLMLTTGPLAGLSASAGLNALEAGGAAAQSITDRINDAYNRGKLQETGEFKIYMDAAREQLASEGEYESEAELAKASADLARKFAIDQSIRSAIYKVAVTGGAIDSVQNMVLYGGLIKPKFMKNALVRAVTLPIRTGTRYVAGTVSEGVSEAAEQWFENGGIIDGAGNITTRTEGMVNAAYNGMLAAQSGNITSATVGGAQRIRAGAAGLRKFVMGGSKDPRILVDLMTISPSELLNLVTKVDENGVRRFAISDLVKKRTVGTADIEEAKKKGMRPNRRGQYTIKKDGKEFKITVKEAEQNDKDIELIAILDDNEIDPKEGITVVNLGDEAEVRRMAELLGIDNKGSINGVLSRIENVKKIDVRVKGRSTLEPPIWSDLDDDQKLQYWKEGKVTFTGHEERGNQTWTRSQILYNSRRNNDTIPEEIANLGDNTFARPDLNSDEYAETAKTIKRLENQIENSALMRKAKQDLENDQKEWDAEAKKNGVGPTVAEFGPRPSRDMPGDPYNFTGARSSTAIIENDLNNIKKQFEKEQADWDKQFGSTHLRDGSIKKGEELFVKDKDQIKTAAVEVAKEKVEKVKSENADVEGIEAMTEDPKAVVINPDDTENYSLSRANLVASTKLEISTRNMKPDAVRQMLKNLEKMYPGISNDIISQEDLAKYEQLPKEVRDKLNQEVQKAPPSSLEQPQLDRPPTGTVVELDGKRYVWLGVPDGVGGMWAEQKPDGSRGTTNHQNHKPLMQKWKDSTLQKDKPQLKTPEDVNDGVTVDKQTATIEKQKQHNNNVTKNIANNGMPMDLEGGVADGVSDIDDQEIYDPSKATDNDQQYKDVEVPQKIKDQYAKVLATKNAIKVNNFLKSLPADQAGSLRANGVPELDTQPTIGTPPEQPAVPQDGGELDINIEPEQEPTVTTTKPDELQVPDVPTQPKSPKPDELKTPTIGTAPEKPADPQDDDSMDAPDLPASVDQIVKQKEPPNLVAPNTDPEAGGPVNFIDPKTLSPSQKKELDDIARRNQADQEKAAGTDPDSRAKAAKDKLAQNQAKLDKVAQQDDDSMDSEDDFTGGITSPNTTNMTGQQNNPNDTSTEPSDGTQTVDPGTNQSQADVAMGLTTPGIATQTFKGKVGKTRQQSKTNQDSKKRNKKGFPGDNKDDETDFKDMLRFNPAKYRDPLDLEKYKGGMGRQLGALGGEQ